MVELAFLKRISRFDAKKFSRVLQNILCSLRDKPQSVAILFSDDAAIQKLNRKYRKKNKPTDVLAFENRESHSFQGQANYLGDIIISVERAKIQAREHQKTINDELFTLAVHGLLHLLGYDHEVSQKKRLEMEALEKQIHQQYWPKLSGVKP